MTIEAPARPHPSVATHATIRDHHTRRVSRVPAVLRAIPAGTARPAGEGEPLSCLTVLRVGPEERDGRPVALVRVRLGRDGAACEVPMGTLRVAELASGELAYVEGTARDDMGNALWWLARVGALHV